MNKTMKIVVSLAYLVVGAALIIPSYGFLIFFGIVFLIAADNAGRA